MLRLQVPYHKVLLRPSDLDVDEFDALLKHSLEASCKHPVIIEIFNMQAQYLLFARGGQLYWAALDRGKGFCPIPFRQFFLELRTLQFPQIVVYYTDLVLYHSLLAYLQKKPELKANSTMIDMDELLDRIEEKRTSAVVSALQPGNLILIRYHEGKPIACYHGPSEMIDKKTDIRELFLVKVYTLSAHRYFDVNLFSDLVLSQAEDARPIPDGHEGTISSFYQGQPPMIVVKLKNRPLKTCPFKGNEMSIGRNCDNDIIIDNLSVSRKHAVITSGKEGYRIMDCESKNGTFLNGKPVKEAALKSGDTILLGKYVLVFEVPQGDNLPVTDLDQTVIIPNFRGSERRGEQGGERDEELHIDYPVVNENKPRLCKTSTDEDFPIRGDSFLIGKDGKSDLRLEGLFAPKKLAEITRLGDAFLLQRVGGKKKISVNGEILDEKILEENDLITIGSDEFVFKR
jgi:pSer/pThr/pTyr-binding forkhead associated (FHA) protein